MTRKTQRKKLRQRYRAQRAENYKYSFGTQWEWVMFETEKYRKSVSKMLQRHGLLPPLINIILTDYVPSPCHLVVSTDDAIYPDRYGWHEMVREKYDMYFKLGVTMECWGCKKQFDPWDPIFTNFFLCIPCLLL